MRLRIQFLKPFFFLIVHLLWRLVINRMDFFSAISFPEYICNPVIAKNIVNRSCLLLNELFYSMFNALNDQNNETKFGSPLHPNVQVS